MLYASSVELFEKLAFNCAAPVGFWPVGGQLGSVAGSHGSRTSGPFGIGNAFRKGCRAGMALSREFKPPVVELASGTVVSAVCGSLSRSPSYEKKKKVLSFKIGPLKVPPKSFCRSSALGCGGLDAELLQGVDRHQTVRPTLSTERTKRTC